MLLFLLTCILQYMHLLFDNYEVLIESAFIFLQGFYWQVGDIVSVVDDDASLYYAQLRGFLQDAYNEKSAIITWLIPTSLSPAVGFDPSTYILGNE